MNTYKLFFLIGLCFFLCLFISDKAFAHCDSLDGPVVNTARAALNSGSVTPVLKWIRKKDEDEIEKAFKKALKVRKLSPEAKELADMYFFETLVRIHRAGEGATYTGLKPAGSVDPGIALADKALEKGSVDELIAALNKPMSEGIKERFAIAMNLKKNENMSVEDGRKYIASYVEFIHYVEKLHLAIQGHGDHHED
jgi:hypothetical protein